ncbi:MAG: DUF3828 domain-containing protein [Xanthobacteraceae bacterium]|jgi:uncharacterized protein DUF3828
MLSRRTIILGAVCMAAAGRAFAADPGATAFVTAIYSAYKGKDAKGVPLENERIIRRYFEATLAAAMANDQKAAARRNEVGLLDFDPFLDAQDWDVGAFDIAVSDAAAGTAKATVKFVNQSEAMTVVLDLVRAKNDWRVYDITWLHDGKKESLRKTFLH